MDAAGHFWTRERGVCAMVRGEADQPCVVVCGRGGLIGGWPAHHAGVGHPSRRTAAAAAAAGTWLASFAPNTAQV